MSQIEQESIQTEIAQIIERSRHHEELFLTDSKTAALQILSFLQRQNILSFSQKAVDIAHISNN